MRNAFTESSNAHCKDLQIRRIFTEKYLTNAVSEVIVNAKVKQKRRLEARDETTARHLTICT